MQDYLTAYVNIYNNTNTKVLEAYNYDLNSRYNWTQFSYSETFKSAYGAPDLGNAQYGFIGKANNFWVGPYGPEITAVNFSLKYSVDPCATNPLYSPSCRGYMDALAKLAPVPVAVADAPPPPPEDGSLPPPPPGNPPPPNGSQQAGPPPPPGSSPPQGSGPAPAGAPRTNETKSAKDDSKAGPSLGSVLSMISSNQARIGNEAKSVVQAAESAAAKDAQQAQAQAEAVAGALTEQSVAGSMSLANDSQGTASKSSSQTQTSVFALPTGAQSASTSTEAIRPPAQVAVTDTTQTTGTGLTITNQSALYNSSASQTASEVVLFETSIVNTAFQLPTGRTANIYEIELPPSEGIKMGTRSTLNDVLEQQPTSQTTAQAQQTDAVKRDIQPNDLAVGVDIASIARQPAGYQAYSIAMPDVSFYAPREIYRNQINVDNVRLLRGLGSDRLHQQLIDMQYK